MAGRLKGKVAVVTAAGQGIGRAIAEAYVREGAKVIATDLAVDKLADLARVQRRKLDVLSTSAVETFAARTGAIDILVNVAGFVHQGTILDCSEADWDFSFNLNVKSMHRTIRAFLPGMIAQGRGSIVNMASVVSSIKGAPNRYVYGATKAAVIGMTRALAADTIKQGVRVNAICPGTIQSPSLDDRIAANAAAQGKSIEAARQAFVDRQPLGRLGTVEEVASLAVYLGSDESAFTTGQALVIDGGFSL
jgi:2-keto-3-deoxy-L-fuconate dehydrogenase